ncbi:MBL fold metallo-hydrolase [uncultured Microscilla sp.]|uniref:cyclic nucleotide-binding domain-containing protein n=1 Tax=uncultured Microscilla sp. TaxID=432653 RepID=UPI00262778C1|nr:MBL fold metallo-hydrolase [uncultured Microscilla sp.]
MIIAPKKIEKIKVATGIYWVQVPEVRLYILCGCPADSVKHLKKRGLIAKVEKDDLEFETGPNAILLSDALLQNGGFSNLAEFPILQMLYSQGMHIPKHPNNTGLKPLMMGIDEQLAAQLAYIHRGNYGLITKDEIMATGMSDEMAEEIMRFKLKFAFGKITTPDQLVDQLSLNKGKVEIRNGVYVERKGFNKYEFSYQDNSVNVNLNLKPTEEYEAPYYLGYHNIKREYFAVLHTGEGNAWDVNRPCMASVVMFQGKIYLIDAGPDLMTSLNALGISINEIEGIFNTHAHDDHFAGLTAFLKSDHRIKYFASPLVRASVAKKLSALMSISEESFNHYFDVQDLALDEWNNINGLEVKPMLSLHPIETNVFYFRTFWDNTYRTYAHLADISSLKKLDSMFDDRLSNDASYQLYQKIKDAYFARTNLKKVDIGGGHVHGEAHDFIDDMSDKIVLAHTDQPLTDTQKEVGSVAPFGSVDLLTPTNQNVLTKFAYDYLKFYFPNTPDYELAILVNCPFITINAGTTLFRKGKQPDHIYLLLTGFVELIFEMGIRNSLSAGSLIGYYIDDREIAAKATCITSCYVQAVQIPTTLYKDFVRRNNMVQKLDEVESLVHYLERTWLFGDNISLPVYIKTAQLMSKQSYKKGDQFDLRQNEALYIVKNGKAMVDSESKTYVCEDFFGAEAFFAPTDQDYKVYFPEDSDVYVLPLGHAIDIPIIYWKLTETFNKRQQDIDE